MNGPTVDLILALLPALLAGLSSWAGVTRAVADHAKRIGTLEQEHACNHPKVAETEPGR